jgi:hypothetical protein
MFHPNINNPGALADPINPSKFSFGKNVTFSISIKYIHLVTFPRILNLIL